MKDDGKISNYKPTQLKKTLRKLRSLLFMYLTRLSVMNVLFI
jgi:hypothetical protein